MPTKRTTKAPPFRADAEQADYASWKVMAAADLANRHDAKPGIIPRRLWKLLMNARGRLLTD
jgi:hypothetical protein